MDVVNNKKPRQREPREGTTYHGWYSLPVSGRVTTIYSPQKGRCYAPLIVRLTLLLTLWILQIFEEVAVRLEQQNITGTLK